MKRVLEGVRVIELATYAAAPGAGRVLADMGADVIKIEPPTGDPHRWFGKNVSAPTRDDENPCFQLDNSNKRGIALNLKSEEGMQVLFDLLKDANIFFSNTRIESLQKLKLTYDDLKPKFPHLIYGHLSGYGLKGKDAGLPGYDITAFWARGGGLADFATEGNGPISAPYAIGDHSASLALATGLAGALYKQQKTGQGDYVLVSLLGMAVWINSLMLTPAQEPYNDKWPKSKLMPMTPMSNTYVCKDGEMVTLAILDYARDWPRFCKMIGREDLTDNPRFSDAVEAKKEENSTELVPIIIDIFLRKERAYWVEQLTKYDLPFGMTAHLKDVVKDEQAWANGYLSHFTYDSGNTTVVPNTPVQFQENKGVECGPAPYLGEHTREVLAEIGYSPEKIEALAQDSVVVCRK